MGNSYNILLIGNIYDNHLLRFVKNLKDINPYVEIDVLADENKNKTIDVGITNLINEIILIKSFPKVRYIGFYYKVWAIRQILVDLKHRKHYDIINIHYPSFEYSSVRKLLKKLSDYLVLTPWGSDVYRINERRKSRLKRLYQCADYVTGSNARFVDDYSRIFMVNQEKIVKLNFGSDTIDYLIDHKDQLDQEISKKVIGVQDKFVITCGYNASPFQNHKKIIEAIEKVKDKLPSNTVLLFPMTYGGQKSYKDEIMRLSHKTSLDCIFFEDYLDIYTLSCLRWSTDLFIHVQQSDAECATLMEYVICGKKIINGSWLKYELFSNNSTGIIEVASFQELPLTIVKAIESESITVSTSLYNDISQHGWRNQMRLWNHFFESIIGEKR